MEENLSKIINEEILFNQQLILFASCAQFLVLGSDIREVKKGFCQQMKILESIQNNYQDMKYVHLLIEQSNNNEPNKSTIGSLYTFTDYIVGVSPFVIIFRAKDSQEVKLLTYASSDEFMAIKIDGENYDDLGVLDFIMMRAEERGFNYLRRCIDLLIKAKRSEVENEL